jgi:hypothetical protein
MSVVGGEGLGEAVGWPSLMARQPTAVRRETDVMGSDGRERQSIRLHRAEIIAGPAGAVDRLAGG